MAFLDGNLHKSPTGFKYYVLHIPTGQFLWNSALNCYWYFCYKRVAMQLVDPECPVNLLSGWGSIKFSHSDIIWDKVSLDEFEIVEILDESGSTNSFK